MNVAHSALSAVIRHSEHYAELGSTNDRATELARDTSVPLPALVTADRQTAGRGRGANRWWSGAGALTFSLVVDLADIGGENGARDENRGNENCGRRILSPIESPTGTIGDGIRLAQNFSGPPPRERWPLVALTAGFAVCEGLRSLAAVPLSIKWPNDVYAADRKLAGILVESPAAALARVVIGVGVNVNNSFAGAPEDVRRRAVSIVDITGRPSDVDATLARIVDELIDMLPTTFATPSPLLQSPLVQRWRTYCLLTGRAVEVDSPAGRIAGVCEGIDEDGALLIRNESGTARCVAGTVVRW
ncbi:MAG: biotin--[acetyl-CoA-carboxylase] ligase [Pirellulales bacterium]